LDGLLLATCAILLLPHVPAMRGRALRAVAAGWCSLLLAWGLANVLNDAWLEQVVKRGWTDMEVPDSTRPNVSWVWLAVLIVGASVAAVTLRRAVVDPTTRRPARF
jgi:hypothetical protein